MKTRKRKHEESAEKETGPDRTSRTAADPASRSSRRSRRASEIEDADVQIAPENERCDSHDQDIVQEGTNGSGTVRERALGVSDPAADDAEADAPLPPTAPPPLPQDDDEASGATHRGELDDDPPLPPLPGFSVKVEPKFETKFAPGFEDDDDDDDDDDDEIAGGSLFRRAPGVSRGRVYRGAECPYMDTINRAVLDFDFEKQCSQTLSRINVYVCLVCGKYFQGRGRDSPAYYHCLQEKHHVFINTRSGKTYCLPDDYEVIDGSLRDIQYNLNPKYSTEEIEQLDFEAPRRCLTLSGQEYYPGAVGLNNLGSTDYLGTIVQCLARVSMLRNHLMDETKIEHIAKLTHAPTDANVAVKLSECFRKMWNSRNFKGLVSPHEFMQAVSVASNKKYNPKTQADPVVFLQWLLNTLHRGLGGTKRNGSSIVHKAFQGELEIHTRRAEVVGQIDRELERGRQEAGVAPEITATTKRVPFLMLGMDLPALPLFKDSMERTTIPQIPLFSLLRKYDGRTEHEPVPGTLRRFEIKRLPEFLVLHFKRFSKNDYFVEKNNTIVNFTVKNLDMGDYLSPTTRAAHRTTKYDLVANICHEGRADSGSFKCHVLHQGLRQWFEMEDIDVAEAAPQLIPVAETYVQIYRLQQA